MRKYTAEPTHCYRCNRVIEIGEIYFIIRKDEMVENLDKPTIIRDYESYCRNCLSGAM